MRWAQGFIAVDWGTTNRRAYLIDGSGHCGEEFEDEMVGFYPLLAFGENRVAASIDTPLHAFLPFPHVDHLHPDWAIALAASANGQKKMEEFNRKYGRKIIWVPWQRPGFELALMLQRGVDATPGCDGLILGGHGLFTWGDTQKACYLNSIRTIDEMGQFIDAHRTHHPVRFGGAAHQPVGRHESRQTAERCRPAYRAAGIRAERVRGETGGDGGAGSAARSAGEMLEVPGIARRRPRQIE